MNVSTALLKRKSTRAFLNKEIEKEKIVHILEKAKYAPSGVNMQPWKVCVVSREKKKSLEDALVAAFRSNEKEVMDYNYYPKQFDEPYKTRRKETGLLLYSALDIKEDENTMGRKL